MPVSHPILDELRTQYRELVDAMREMLVIHAIDGSILLANHAAQELVGHPEAELLRRNIKDFIPASEHGGVRERAATRVAQLSRRMYSYEVTIVPAEGSPQRIEVDSAPILAEGEPVAVVVLARPKDARYRERRLEDQRQVAVLASQAKSEFVAHLSHEVRTPINVVFGMIDMALDESLPSAARQPLERARDAARTLLTLVDDVLEFSRVEARKYALRPRAFSLSARIATTLETVAAMAARRGLSLAAEVAADVPDDLVGDPDRLHQVLVNLLTNALKFTREGGVRIGVQRASTPAPPGVHLLFSVADTGIGIAVEDRGAIFDPFRQVGSGSETSQGTGLGLAIAREIVTLFGGQIWVESEPGRGSTFYFTALLDQGAPR